MGDLFEEYMNLDSSLKDHITYTTYANCPIGFKEYLTKSGSQELSENILKSLNSIPWISNTDVDSYYKLNNKIRRLISMDLFLQMPQNVQSYLIDSKEGEIKESQIVYLSRIPWGNEMINNISIPEAKDLLDKTHYGMVTVKEKILRYIACQKHIGDDYGAVLLLIGPPGVGKTSIAASIAEAMGRPFVKISLAGLSDAVALSGTSTVFSNSKPGKIIEAIINAKHMSPLILLDEIDKMGQSTENGDPVNALINILDSDRTNFIDDSFGVSIDISKILFIATANTLSTISPILIDRLEVVELNEYTREEKIAISKRYIWPSLIQENKLGNINLPNNNGVLCNPYTLSIDDNVIEYIIDNLTNEPGVRSLKRYFNQLCQAVISLYYSTGEMVDKITIDNMKKMLSTIHYEEQTVEAPIFKKKEIKNKKLYKEKYI